MANTDLGFNVVALDKASKTFIKMAAQVERLSRKLEELDHKRVELKVDVDTSRANRKIEQTRTQIAALTRHELAGLITAAASIAPAFVAAGFAAGAFGAAALPSLVKVVSAQQDIGEAWAGLDNRQRIAALSLRGLIRDYSDLADAFEPQTLEVFNTGLDIGRRLMVQLEPLIETSADAFVRLGHEVDAALGSPTWTSFVDFLEANAAPSIQATGEAFGNLTALVLNTVRALNPLASELLPLVSNLAKMTASLVDAHPALAQFAATALLLRSAAGPASRVVEKLSGTFSALTAEGATAGSRLKAVTGLLGGPWGVAVTGAAAVLGIFIHQQAEATQRVQNYTDALRESSGAVNTTVRQRVAQAFADERLLRAARELGLTTRDLVGATLGEEDATRRVNAAIDANTVAVHGQFTTTKQLTGAARLVKGAVDDQRSAFASARKEMQLNAFAQRSAATAAQVHAQQVRDLQAALAGGAEQAENLKQALDALTGANQNAEQTSIAYEQAVDDLTASIRENGRTHDINTAKGRANRQALLQLAKAAQENIIALQKEGASTATVSKRMADARRRFIDAAEAMGFSRKRAEQLADRLLGIPKSVTTHIRLPGIDRSIRQVGNLRTLIDNLHDKTVRITTINTATGSVRSVRAAFAEGGIVRRPQIASIAEDGPEVVIPLTKPARARQLAREARLGEVLGADGGGSTVYNVTVNHVPTFTNAQDIMRGIRQAELVQRFHRRR